MSKSTRLSLLRRRRHIAQTRQEQASQWYAPVMQKEIQNKRLYQGDLRPLLRLPDITQKLYSDIRDRLCHGNFVRILTVGPNNSGKSSINLRLAIEVSRVNQNRIFSLDLPDEAPDRIQAWVGKPMRGKIFITSDISETLTIMGKKCQAGDVAKQDEDLAPEGADSSLIIDRARRLMKAGRAFQVSYIVSTPELPDRLTMFDWILHTWRINFKKRITRCYVMDGQTHELLGWADIQVLPMGDVYRPYLKKKWSALSELFESEGSWTVARTIDHELVDQIVGRVRKLADEQGYMVDNYKIFKGLARSMRIKGGVDEQEFYITLAHSKWKAFEAGCIPIKGKAQLPLVSVHDDFITVMKNVIRRRFKAFTKTPIQAERWILRYFDGMTYKAIAEELGERLSNTVQKGIKDIDDKLSKTEKSRLLEEAVLLYLNTHIMLVTKCDSMEGPSRTSSLSDNSSTDLSWVGGTGPNSCDVALMDDQAVRAAVNCKLFFEHRSSWDVKVSPEAVTCPDRCYVVLMELGPPAGANGPKVYRVPPSTKDLPDYKITTAQGSVEELDWDDWLNELRGLMT